MTLKPDIEIGTKGIKDIITAEGVDLTKNTSLKDESPYDNDTLTVNFNTDLLDAPKIDGIEEIIFTTAEAH